MSATPDPTDAKADGNFGSAGGSHRAGYGDKLANAEKWARKGGTLNAGEGAVLCEEIDRLRERLAACERDLLAWRVWGDKAASGHPDAPLASLDHEVRAVIGNKYGMYTITAVAVKAQEGE